MMGSANDTNSLVLKITVNPLLGSRRFLSFLSTRLNLRQLAENSP
jgi:hypothetical protein